VRTRWLAAITVSAAAVLPVLPVTACSSGSPQARPPSPPTSSTTPSSNLPTAALRCSDVIGTDQPTAGMQTVAGAVALPSLRMPALGANPSGETGANRLFAKWGLLVRAKTQAVLTVTDPDHVSIGWGSPGPMTKRFVVPGCGTSGWLAFAGGYYVDQPRCITLEVTSGNKRERVQIGVGTACPGQQPPIPT
jgi:hypothetical protein